MQEWQDIKTAPKDGTLILGGVNENGVTLCRTMHWRTTEVSKYNPEGGYWCCPNHWGAKVFTHWQKQIPIS